MQRSPQWLIALAVVAVLAAGAFCGLWITKSPHGDPLAGTEDMQAAARKFTIAMYQFDAKTIDRNAAEVQKLSTGTFADYANQQFNGPWRQDVKSVNASGRVDIRNLSVQSFSGAVGTVFVAADVTVANNNTSTPQVAYTVSTLSMRKVHGDWKVSGVTPLVAPKSALPPTGGTGGSGGSGSSSSSTTKPSG